MLTPHMKDVLVALVAYKREHDEMPTIRELTEKLGYASQTATTQASKRLAALGYIEIIPNKARGVKITKKGYRNGKDTNHN